MAKTTKGSPESSGPIKTKPQKHFKISFRTILTILTLVLLIYVIYANFADIKEALGHLGETNILILLLLIPEQLFMYYCCGQMFFSTPFPLAVSAVLAILLGVSNHLAQPLANQVSCMLYAMLLRFAPISFRLYWPLSFC